jgi:hypothetical protein
MGRDLLSARQCNDGKVRNFIRRVIRLSKRLGDVSDRQVVQIVWDGALSCLRLKWAAAGFDFETSLSAPEIAAKGYEVAETIRRIEAAKRAAETSSKAGSQYSAKSSSNTSTKKSRLTEEEHDQFRAKNRCFYSRAIGHSNHNFPRRASVRFRLTQTVAVVPQSRSTYAVVPLLTP